MQRRKSDQPGPDYTRFRCELDHQRRPRRVLMIEPSRFDRLLVNTALMLKGTRETKVTEVADFDLGLSLLLQRRYDLVLLQDADPGRSPSDTTRAIRGVAPTTPIIRHTHFLDQAPENGNGLDQLVEAVEAALASAPAPATAAVEAAAVTVAMPMPSYASELWTAASAVS